MKIIESLQTQSFTIYDDVDTLNRCAIISFGKERSSKKWEFRKVEYSLSSNKNYSLEDWQFLGAMAEYIEKKLKELNK